MNLCPLLTPMWFSTFICFFLNFFFNFEMNLGKRGLPSPNTQIPKVQAAATTAAATLQNC